ncbi:putative addiction module component [Rubripirellula tenax]|uniref:Putative addiction module component n=1 Tax=Rubripirellula tenax TaxID=2528015 RepID=A0A5C6FEH0_9BACT|nr:addiction module protein [Rubripirellula tenax]TWU58506.1 putative addiction module component [Rubripirellula tenax]
MSVDLPLDSMSVSEKMQVLETVWSSLCQNPGDVQSPEWHQQVLKERTQRLENGEASVSTWADAKARLLKLGQ